MTYTSVYLYDTSGNVIFDTRGVGTGNYVIALVSKRGGTVREEDYKVTGL